jgi:hypothetical protein
VLEALIARLFGPRLASRLVPWLALLVLGVSCYLLAGIFGSAARLETWLFWRYLHVWGWCVLFAAACYAAGSFLVGKLSDSVEPGLGRFTLSFATGVFAFFLLTALAGFLKLYGRAAFVATPLLLLALGGKQLWRELLTARERFRTEPGWLSLGPLQLIGFGCGTIALFVIYLGVLVPENAAYDSRWYHLALAENYAAAGGITRSDEGSATATVPHLASILYTWAFCLPWGGLFEKVELAAHLEFVLFIFTLPGVVALVRHLVPDARALVAWLAVFTFPSVFVYDSSLHVAADHVAALWSIPVYLAFARAYERLSLRSCLLFAVQVSAVLMSKYTAVIAVVGPVLVLSLRGAWLALSGLRHSPRRVELAPLGSLGATLGAGLLLTAPHWLKNLLWHGDPIYPILHRHLPVRPWTSGSAYLFEVYQSTAWGAVGTTGEKLKGTLKALYDHSYGAYNWPDFHGPYPVFGSLFTFSLVLLPVLSGTRRIWLLTLLTQLGVALWYWFFHAERYLQALVPWMAAVVASLAILAWRSGWPARAGVVALGGLQIVWGADMIFWPLHRMTGKSQVGMATDFFAKGYGVAGPTRLKPFEEFTMLGRALPPEAKVLVHREHLRLGLGAMTVSDAPRIQYGISYVELGSPRAVDRWFREHGITHMVWQRSVVSGEEPLGAELIFHSYASSFTLVGQVASRSLGRIPQRPPPERLVDTLVFVCDGTYQAGTYPVSSLNVSPYSLPNVKRVYPPPRKHYALGDESAPSLGYAVINAACPGAPSPLAGFKPLAVVGNTLLLERP